MKVVNKATTFNLFPEYSRGSRTFVSFGTFNAMEESIVKKEDLTIPYNIMGNHLPHGPVSIR